jgi:hypothetical protein
MIPSCGLLRNSWSRTVAIPKGLFAIVKLANITVSSTMTPTASPLPYESLKLPPVCWNVEDVLGLKRLCPGSLSPAYVTQRSDEPAATVQTALH